MGIFRYIITVVFLLVSVSFAIAQDVSGLVDKLAQGSFTERGAAIASLVSSGSPSVVTSPIRWHAICAQIRS
jgi:hypothetical protein